MIGRVLFPECLGDSCRRSPYPERIDWPPPLSRRSSQPLSQIAPWGLLYAPPKYRRCPQQFSAQKSLCSSAHRPHFHAPRPKPGATTLMFLDFQDFRQLCSACFSHVCQEYIGKKEWKLIESTEFVGPWQHSGVAESNKDSFSSLTGRGKARERMSLAPHPGRKTREEVIHQGASSSAFVLSLPCSEGPPMISFPHIRPASISSHQKCFRNSERGNEIVSGMR